MARDGFLFMNGNGEAAEEEDKESPSSASRSAQISSPPSAVGVGVNGGGVNYICHTVTKFDTLAGVAIKYGVEVADIKRLNGLVTDLQMFALKTLQIPLPGRHPPSPILSNGDENPQRPSSSNFSRRHSDILDSFQSLKLRSCSERKISPAMSSLQGYYGTKSEDHRKASAEGCEMSVYHKGEASYLEDGPISNSEPPLTQHHRISKSVANGLTSGNDDPVRETESSSSVKWIEKLTKRVQKSEADFRTPEKLLKEESGNNTPISAITGKALALRPKSANRTVSGGVDGEVNGQNTIPLSFSDPYSTELVNGVRKSSSTPILQDPDNNGSLSSIWTASKWSLKPDFQGLSASVIARPIFDGLPKPMSWKNKTALD